MEQQILNILDILKNVDWGFAIIILIGGQYWGANFFSISKNKSINFLAFATAFAVVWLLIKFFTKGIASDEVSNLFLTYLFTTAFYNLLAKRFFKLLEGTPASDTKKEP